MGEEQPAGSPPQPQSAMLFEDAPAAVVVLRGADHVVEWANAAARAIVGDRPLVGLPYRKVAPVLTTTPHLGALAQAASTRAAVRLDEAELFEPDSEKGDAHYVDLLFQPFDDGRPGVLVFGVDVTDTVRARLEAEERASKTAHTERLLAAVLTQLPSGVSIMDAKTRRLLFSNPQAEAISQRPIESGAVVDDFPTGIYDSNGQEIPPAKWPGPVALNTGATIRGQDLTFRRPDGSEATVRANAGPVRDENGEIVAAVVTYDDITLQRRRDDNIRFVAEASRLLSSSLDFEATLRTFADLAVPRLADWCGIEIVREDGSTEQLAVAHSNPEKVRFARELRERYPPDPDAQTGVPHVLRTGKSEIYPEVSEELIRMGARDEEHLRISLELGLRSAIIAPLVARDRVLGAITLVFAESERRYDEHDLALAEDIASRAALAVDNARLYGEAQRAIQIRDDFLSVASHELKTPLTSMHLLVGGVMRKLERGEASEIKPERLQRLDAQLGRLATLIDELLDVSRLNAGKFELNRQDVQLGGLLEEVVERFVDEAAASGVTLALDGAHDVVGRWDPQRLDQVFTNLVSNALKYGGRTPVEVRAEPCDLGVRVVVKDQGPGIQEKDLERIFERFERAASTRKHGGMGLGLWIARQMVEAHGGSLSAQSVTGDGATFIVELPVGGEGVL